MAVLVDSNVLLDVMTGDPQWFSWSAEALARYANDSVLVINPLIYAEVSVRFERVEELERALPLDTFVREPLPWEAGFLAGKSFISYRARGGERTAPLTDFHIGAHAAVRGHRLLTRDRRRYATYFPKLELLAP